MHYESMPLSSITLFLLPENSTMGKPQHPCLQNIGMLLFHHGCHSYQPEIEQNWQKFLSRIYHTFLIGIQCIWKILQNKVSHKVILLESTRSMPHHLNFPLSFGWTEKLTILGSFFGKIPYGFLVSVFTTIPLLQPLYFTLLWCLHGVVNKGIDKCWGGANLTYCLT